MDPEQWRRARAWFEQGEDEPASAWEADLRARESDPAVVQMALSLRRAGQRLGESTGLQHSAPRLIESLAEVEAGREAERCIGRRVGPWTLVRLLGQGGMGTVWLAERAADGFVQRAALKLMRDSLAGADWERRFRTERRILATLDHPGIARLIDGGATAQGEPYFALEFVEGQPLGEWCDARSASVDERIACFIGVCEAVSHAHARLVVHRDLKPGNLLATAEGQVKLLDFGIAKLLDPDQTDLDATAMHVRLFTPGYAAPEQCRGEAAGTAADVYSLGVLLYELLCGLSPTRDDAGVLRAPDRDPIPPSERLRAAPASLRESISRARSSDPDRLARALRGDLDAIASKALRPSPGERYASVDALTADLRAWQAHRPVAARRGSGRYRLGRLLRRHRLAAAFALLALLALLTGTTIALWQAREARIQRDDAVAQARTAEAALGFLTGVFEQADPEHALGESPSARELLDRGTRQLRFQLEERPEVRAPLLRALGRAYLGLDLSRDAMPLLEEALRLRRAQGDGRAIARARADLALALGKAGDPAAELEALRDILASHRDDLDASLHAELRGRLATALFNRSEHAEAEREFDAALALRRLHSEPDPSLLMAYAALLSATGRRERASQLIEDGLADARERLPPRHPALAALMATHARAIGVDGRTAEALALYREALSIKRAVYGDAHDSTLTTLNGLGAMLDTSGDPQAAEPVLRAALDGRRRLLGERHPSVAVSMHNLARVLNRLGRAADAAPLAREAMELARTHYGADDVAVAISAATLAQAELDLGRPRAAADLLQEAIRIQQKLGGEQSPRLAPLLAQRSWSLQQAGTAEPDCAGAQRARRIDVAAGGVPDAYVEAMLGACLFARGDRREGGSLLRSAHARATESGIDPHAPLQRAVLDAYRALADASR